MWRPLAFSAVLGLFGLQLGCYVSAEPLPPPPPPQAAVTVDYNPLYYQGHVVLYDDYDYRPYYVVRGRPYYIPRTYVRYDTYVRHYHRNPAAYQRWHTHHPQYRHYRMHAPRTPRYHHRPARPPPRRHHRHN